MRKAQGALEYLIIIAAVLAIAAIVVLFLTGAFKGTSAEVSKCRNAASSCVVNVATGVFSSYSDCVTGCVGACADAGGKDVLAPTITVSATTCTRAGLALGCAYCAEGNTSIIQK